MKIYLTVLNIYKLYKISKKKQLIAKKLQNKKYKVDAYCLRSEMKKNKDSDSEQTPEPETKRKRGDTCKCSN